MDLKDKKKVLIAQLFLIPLVLLFLTSLIINLLGLDLKVSGNYWDNESAWYLSNNPVFVFLYKFGPIPIFALAGASLALILFRFRKVGFSYPRRVCLLVILSLVFGPGLLVNAVFKDNFGRPRPRSVIEFGGEEKFVPLLVYNGEGSGKSFPSGHASMGFLWLAFVPWAIVLGKRKLVLVLISLGLLHGGFMGFGRIVQGGHFLGDVLWSAGMDYLVGCVLLLILFRKEIFPVSADSDGNPLTDETE